MRLCDSVIFIDEPELSLHADWQRQLFPILARQQSSNQFIVATHSPFIYSKYPDKEIELADKLRGRGITMPKGTKVAYLTADEIVATIGRSAFPSIVTEGDDDVIALRRLEEEFADIGLTLLPAGGRTRI